MTVIATDGRTMAADSLITFGGERGRRPGSKIVAGSDGRIIGVAGAAGLVDALAYWYCEDGVPSRAPLSGPKDAGWAMIVYESDGTLYYVSSDTGYRIQVDPPFAIGSGGDVALGAMYAGATPEQACEIACRVRIDCGGPIQVMPLPAVEVAE